MCTMGKTLATNKSFGQPHAWKRKKRRPLRSVSGAGKVGLASASSSVVSQEHRTRIVFLSCDRYEDEMRKCVQRLQNSVPHLIRTQPMVNVVTAISEGNDQKFKIMELLGNLNCYSENVPSFPFPSHCGWNIPPCLTEAEFGQGNFSGCDTSRPFKSAFPAWNGL